MSDHDHDHEHGHDHDHGDHDHDGHEHEHDQDDRAEQRARRQVALAQIRQYGDPVLRMRANEVEAFDDELARLTERMIGVMHDAEGVGLAATQVGILRRLFVFHDEDEDRVVVNPVLTVRGKRDRGRRGGLPLARPDPDARRARGRGDARRVRRHGSARPPRARGHVRRASSSTSSTTSTAR